MFTENFMPGMHSAELNMLKPFQKRCKTSGGSVIDTSYATSSAGTKGTCSFASLMKAQQCNKDMSCAAQALGGASSTYYKCVTAAVKAGDGSKMNRAEVNRHATPPAPAAACQWQCHCCRRRVLRRFILASACCPACS